MAAIAGFCNRQWMIRSQFNVVIPSLEPIVGHAHGDGDVLPQQFQRFVCRLLHRLQLTIGNVDQSITSAVSSQASQ